MSAEISAEQLAALAAEFAEQETAQRRVRQDDGRQWSFTDTTEAEVVDALNSIPNADLPYDEYLRLMMAVKNGLGDSGEAVFDAWSRRSGKYNEPEQIKYWRSIKAEGGITVGTLFFEAEKHGWKSLNRTNNNGKSNLDRQDTIDPDGGDPNAIYIDVDAFFDPLDAIPHPDGDTTIKDSTPFEPEPNPPSDIADIALANAFAEGKDGDDLLYAPKLGAWFVYRESETRYAEDELLFVWTLVKRFLTGRAHELYEKVYAAIVLAAGKNADKATEREADREAKKASRALTTKAKVAAILDLAKSHPRLAVSDRSFDADPWLLNTPAGVMNLTTGKTRPGARKDRFSKITKVTSDKDMPTPIFDQFMLEIMGWKLPVGVCQCAGCLTSVGRLDDERLALHQAEAEALVAYQMRVYGYALTGDVTEQALFLQIGEGGNGKGVLNDLISRDIMGRAPDGYSCVIPIEALLAPKGERHPTELTGLWHARLALARESDEGVRWNEGRIKSLTGGDPVQARKMRQDYNEFEPTHKLLVFGNTTPIMRRADQHAMQRRVQMTNFPQKWDEEADEANHVLKADKQLSERLRAEAPGVLAKLIEGCLDWRDRKSLEPPKTVREASRKYLAQQNVILRWLDERCDRTDPATGTKTNDLWKDYSKWAEANKEWTCKRNQFNERLERAGIKIIRTATEKGRCEGIALLPQESAANND